MSQMLMPQRQPGEPLPNGKQEKYAKARAMGLMPAKAAVSAGYMAGSAGAALLEKDDEVKARMDELAAENAQRREAARQATTKAAEVVGELTGVTHAWVVRELVQLVADAKGDGDYKEANAALKMIGEHLGMWGKMPEDGQPGAGQTAGALAEATLEKLERLERMNSSLAQLDAPVEEHKPPSERDIAALVGRKSLAGKSEAKMLTGSEADVLQTQDVELTPEEMEADLAESRLGPPLTLINVTPKPEPVKLQAMRQAARDVRRALPLDPEDIPA